MIEPLLSWTSLLSVTSAQNVWGRFDHQRPTYDVLQILLALTAALVVAAAGLALLRFAGRFRASSPRALFRELCRAHGLDASGRRLLKKLAAARGLSNPSLLFVEPKFFEATDMPAALQSSGTRLQRLHDDLFR